MSTAVEVIAITPDAILPPGLTRDDAVNAATLLHEIEACHPEQADRVADETGLGHLTTPQLEALVDLHGLSYLTGLHPSIAAGIYA